MRAPNSELSPISSGAVRLLSGAAAAALLAAGSHAADPLVAQNAPGGFSLPEGTPTPTPAPEGPADERAGVPIGPRVIPEQRPSATPTPPPSTSPATAPSQTPDQNLPQQPSARATQAPITSPSAGNASTRAQPGSGTPAGPEATRLSPSPPAGSPATAPGAVRGPATNPGFETDLLPGEGAQQIGPDDWYDVSPQGTEGVAPARSSSSGAEPSSNQNTDLTSGDEQSWIAILRANQFSLLATLGVLIAAIAGFVWWRRRQVTEQAVPIEGPSLAMGLRQSLSDTVTGDAARSETNPPAATDETRLQETAQAQPATAAPPPSSPASAKQVRLDLALDIISASRSVMMFSVDLRLEIANRSDNAARDMKISAQMTCAERGGSNAAPIASAQPIGEITRIGPHQSRSVSGQLSIPLSEVKVIQQGAKPLFIPLIHITIEGEGQKAATHSYVLGTPSASSAGRVHPLTLDGPPGGMPGLRAQQIKAPLSDGAKATQPA